MKRPSSIIRFAITAILSSAAPSLLMAADAPKPSSMNNPVAIIMISVIAALAIVIALLGYVLSGFAQYYVKRSKEEAGNSGVGPKILSTLLFCWAGFSAFAQNENAPVVKDRSVAGLSETTFFALMSVIVIELVVIIAIAWFLKRLMARESAALTEAVPAAPKESVIKKWWDRVNSFRSIHEEAAIDLGHDYDSIRELDNRLPPWWLYGFYCTILFAAVYLWRAQVSHAAPSSMEEYTASVREAEKQKEIYLANAANKVDENTVKPLGPDAIAAGKAIFTTTCAACHGVDGGGAVGPNLTDDYWLHGGTLKDVFKTIKYGVQEKGMKSWKDDFSPVQIAQLANYVKSIKGAKVATPKEPQGELFKEIAADTTQKSAATRK